MFPRRRENGNDAADSPPGGGRLAAGSGARAPRGRCACRESARG
jgi:hypothetical protein